MRSPTYKRIITHNGQFHADDVMACAIIQVMLRKDLPIERMNSVEAVILNNPRDIVVDVGGSFNMDLSNFDHHMDKELESACVMVMWQFVPIELHEQIYEHLLKEISLVDRGKLFTSDGSINSIIRSFNSLEKKGFDQALKTCKLIFQAAMATAVESLHSELYWNQAIKRKGLAVFNSKKIIHNWKSLARNANIVALLCPGRNPGEWNLISRDTREYRIPTSKHQTFIHTSGFMAVYASVCVALIDCEEFGLIDDREEIIELLNTQGGDI